MKIELTTHAWLSGLGWTLANTAGWFLGYGLMDYVLRGLGWLSNTTPMAIQGVIYTAGAGILALWQWLPLRSRVHQPIAWLALSVLGFAAGWSGYRLVEAVTVRNAGEEGIAGPMLFFTVIGLAVGVAQWLMLRRALERAGWWVAANAVGWALGSLALFAVNAGPVAFYTLFGLLSGAVTGLCLALLSDTSPTGEPSPAKLGR